MFKWGHIYSRGGTIPAKRDQQDHILEKIQQLVSRLLILVVCIGLGRIFGLSSVLAWLGKALLGSQQVTARVDVGRIDSQCFSKVPDSFFEPALYGEHNAKIIMYPGDIRLDSQCLGKLCDGLVEFALTQESLCEIAVRFGQVRVKSDGFIKVSNCLVKFALAEERICQVTVSHSEIRSNLQGVGVVLNCLVKFTLLGERVSEVALCIWEIGL